MEPKITLKNLELNGDAQRHIERNLSKLARHLSNLDDLKVDLLEQPTKSRQDRFVAQLTVSAKGVLLRSEERGDNLLTALDRAIEKMDRQIDSYKGKLQDKSRAGGKPGAEAATTTYRVVKRKPFVTAAMTTDEAIEQMELLNHSFFIFQDADSLELKLVYKRNDGDYGLIEPQAA